MDGEEGLVGGCCGGVMWVMWGCVVIFVTSTLNMQKALLACNFLMYASVICTKRPPASIDKAAGE